MNIFATKLSASEHSSNFVTEGEVARVEVYNLMIFPVEIPQHAIDGAGIHAGSSSMGVGTVGAQGEPACTSFPQRRLHGQDFSRMWVNLSRTVGDI